MKKKGFTLIEVLTVVIIIGVLTSIALPMYMRSVERARATEAMSTIKTLNDSIYTYHVEKERCPERFSQLVIAISPDQSATNHSLSSATVDTKYFTFVLEGNNVPYVPGTSCRGALAKRRNGGDYKYGIYNPYRKVQGEAHSLACSVVDNPTAKQRAKSVAICESLGLYTVATAIP